MSNFKEVSVAKLIVVLHADKVRWLIYTLKHRGKFFVPNAQLFSKREGMGTFVGDVLNIGRLRDTSRPAKKVSGAEIAKAFGADTHIPLQWICSFKLTDDTLSIVFDDGVHLEVNDDKLFFVKNEEKAFISVDIVQKVCEFGTTLKVLWPK